MDRNQMIEELLNEVDDWDLDTLIDFAKEYMSKRLNSLNDDEVKDYYNNTFPHNAV